MRRYLLDWLEDPSGMATYYGRQLLSATVCRIRGHRRDRTAVILGTCTRCWDDLPTRQSIEIWDLVRQQQDEQAVVEFSDELHKCGIPAGDIPDATRCLP